MVCSRTWGQKSFKSQDSRELRLHFSKTLEQVLNIMRVLEHFAELSPDWAGETVNVGGVDEIAVFFRVLENTCCLMAYYLGNEFLVKGSLQTTIWLVPLLTELRSLLCQRAFQFKQDSAGSLNCCCPWLSCSLDLAPGLWIWHLSYILHSLKTLHLTRN